MEAIKVAVLVYQAGIANVFALDSMKDISVDRRKAGCRRVMQSDFGSCEMFVRGLAAAGCRVSTFACNQTGDIIGAEWSADLDAQPFSDKFSPVFA